MRPVLRLVAVLALAACGGPEPLDLDGGHPPQGDGGGGTALPPACDEGTEAECQACRDEAIDRCDRTECTVWSRNAQACLERSGCVQGGVIDEACALASCELELAGRNRCVLGCRWYHDCGGWKGACAEDPASHGCTVCTVRGEDDCRYRECVVEGSPWETCIRQHSCHVEHGGVIDPACEAEFCSEEGVAFYACLDACPALLVCTDATAED